MAMVQKIATNPTFIHGRYVPKGGIVQVDTEKLSGKERNFADAGSIGPAETVQVSAVAPTGPNPGAPQQIPHDAVQTVEGYQVPGAVLVGETTSTKVQAEAEALLDDNEGTQAKVAEVLVEAREEQAEADNAAKRDAFDHDGDGKAGGAPKGGNKKK